MECSSSMLTETDGFIVSAEITQKKTRLNEIVKTLEEASQERRRNFVNKIEKFIWCCLSFEIFAIFVWMKVLVDREKYQEYIKNEIHSLEYEIAKVSEHERTTKRKLESINIAGKYGSTCKPKTKEQDDGRKRVW